jgi:N6-adenosine-specific RNA methylase IME4/ParB-like chromosome segregation protein Spo0J
MPLVPVKSIRVENRFRKQLGDLTPLVDSIRALGLLHPILVNREHRLIAGARRLGACKQLGWRVIPARVIDLDELRAEHDENVVRQDFLPSEAVGIKRAMEELERQRARDRMSEGGKLSKKGMITGGKIPPLKKGKTRDKLAAHVGMSYKTLRRAEEILIAGEQQPEKYGDLVKEMDSKGTTVTAVYRRLKIRQEAERLKTEPPPFPNGKYSVIVVDPPWPYKLPNLLSYPAMSFEEIQRLPVMSLADENCVVFLWSTNFHLHKAFHVLEAWGFEYKTIISWVKTAKNGGNFQGVGYWVRNNTEQILVGARGRPLINLVDQTTAFLCPPVSSEHSRKPAAFFKMIESLCPQKNRLEMFARSKREGWDGHGLHSIYRQ